MAGTMKRMGRQWNDGIEGEGGWFSAVGCALILGDLGNFLAVG